MSMKDLKPGMEVTGTVRNVIDFGVFVDIGVHQDGLVHISQISDDYISHPSDVLKVGDIVKVKVLDVDLVKEKIALTMKTTEKPHGLMGTQRIDRERKEGHRNAERYNGRKNNNNKNTNAEQSKEDLLKELYRKFGR